MNTSNLLHKVWRTIVHGFPFRFTLALLLLSSCTFATLLVAQLFAASRTIQSVNFPVEEAFAAGTSREEAAAKVASALKWCDDIRDDRLSDEDNAWIEKLRRVNAALEHRTGSDHRALLLDPETAVCDVRGGVATIATPSSFNTTFMPDHIALVTFLIGIVAVASLLHLVRLWGTALRHDEESWLS